MKRWKGLLIAGGVGLGLFIALVVITALLPATAEEAEGSITNSRGDGTRALAQVLRANGVEVNQVTTLPDALAAAEAGTTLAVYLTEPLSDQAASQLRYVPAEVVFIAANRSVDLTEMTADTAYEDWWYRDDESAPKAECDDPDALAAGRISPSEQGAFATDVDAITCFPDDTEAGLFVRAETLSHKLAILSSPKVVHNQMITEQGNAALALRALGKHPKLTWYLPGPDAIADPGGPSAPQPNNWVLLPGWAGAVFAALLVAAAAAALWRGRRFGPLVREALPVAVPASEVTTDLGRLYRQASARGHAAAGLRAATLSRLSARLGLTADASPELVIERLAAAAGEPPERLGALFYGPAPTTDAELVELASQLTDLERKLTA